MGRRVDNLHFGSLLFFFIKIPFLPDDESHFWDNRAGSPPLSICDPHQRHKIKTRLGSKHFTAGWGKGALNYSLK